MMYKPGHWIPRNRRCRLSPSHRIHNRDSRSKEISAAPALEEHSFSRQRLTVGKDDTAEEPTDDNNVKSATQIPLHAPCSRIPQLALRWPLAAWS